ncbi:MAG: TolC family protein [Pirellulales bacterium]
MLLTGCHPTQPFFFGEDGDLSHFVDRAGEISYPDVEVEGLPEANFTAQPLTLANADFENFWELTLNEAVKIALSNSKVLRNLGGRVDVQTDQLLRNPDGIQTIYNPALQETGTGINQPLGPEAALSEFDAEVSASVFWEKLDSPLNIPFDPTDPQRFGRQQANQQDLGSFQAQISKTSRSGGTYSLRNRTNYDASNVDSSFRPFKSEWREVLEAEIRQPLLQGAGAEYNGIAGPFSPFTGVGSRAFDGVVLARINTDRSLADFEAGVRELLRDLESVYWELHFAYRNLEARKRGFEAAQEVWYNVKGQADKLGDAEEARAREQYFAFRAAVEAAKSQLLGVESRLRYLMGLSTADGRMVRPADEPTSARLTFEWHEILGEALGRNVDLRKQKWRIKQRELEMIAAKNHLLPRLDAVAQYRWNGFGDDLIDPNSDGQGKFDNAFANLADGDFQEWQMGVQGSFTLGFRQELAAMRNAQLQLSRDKAVLQEQELELSHVLAESVRQIAEQFQLMETQFNRRRGAKAQVDAINSLIVGDVVGDRSAFYYDQLLDAQRRLSDSEVEYYRAVVDYNRSILQLHFHRGTLLEYNQVFLAEGPWPAKAYFDAIRVARQRDASLFVDYGGTRPTTVSRGPYRQLARDPHESSQQPHLLSDEIDSDADRGDAEELPAPEPLEDEESLPDPNRRRDFTDAGRAREPRLLQPIVASGDVPSTTHVSPQVGNSSGRYRRSVGSTTVTAQAPARSISSVRRTSLAPPAAEPAKKSSAPAASDSRFRR